MWLANMMQEDGKTSMYTWILSTGWWAGRAPINPDAVVVVGVLCTCLIGGFIYINRYSFRDNVGKLNCHTTSLCCPCNSGL